MREPGRRPSPGTPGSHDPPPDPYFVTRSPAMARAVAKATHFARFDDLTVVLIGETGVGKWYFAALIHRRSPRASGPFVLADGAQHDDALVRSELFGHEKGAFTGASRRNAGLILEAHTGSLFLDELTHASLSLQGKLLSMLDGNWIRGVGMSRPIPVDVRLIVGTSVPLAELVARGQLLEDLMYRFGLCHVRIPSLRERREDIPGLAEQFVRELAPSFEYSDGKFPTVHPMVMAGLKAAELKGNVRELRSIIQRLMVEADGALVLTPDMCVDELAFLTNGVRGGPREVQRERVRREFVDGAKSRDLIALTGKSKSTINNWLSDLRSRPGSPLQSPDRENRKKAPARGD